MNRAILLLVATAVACDRPTAQEHPAGHASPGSEAAPSMPGMPGMEAAAVVGNAGAITPSPTAAGIMGLRVAPVRAGPGQVPRRAPALVTFDPTASVRVTAQSGGQIRSLTVPAPGDAVTRGQILARLYDPSLRSILEELRVARTLGDPWRSAAASRARASGVPEEEIRAVLDGGAVPETFAVRSPSHGVVSSRPAAEGAWIAPGGIIAMLIDPGAVFVELSVDGAPPLPGSIVTLRDPGGSTAVVAATVLGVLPEASAAGVRVRVRPVSPVTPGRPLVASWIEDAPASLWVPASALVDTGTRQVVFVSTGAGFVPRPVQPGVRAGDEIEIRSGLTAGESVAATGAFLLDSETQIGAMGHAGHGG